MSDDLLPWVLFVCWIPALLLYILGNADRIIPTDSYHLRRILNIFVVGFLGATIAFFSKMLETMGFDRLKAFLFGNALVAALVTYSLFLLQKKPNRVAARPQGRKKGQSRLRAEKIYHEGTKITKKSKK